MSAARRVLVVEDDRFLRRACEASLRQRGLSITTAVDGVQALDKARDEPPDLILLDLLMPRMTGIEVLRALRADESTRQIPVLILSNSSREEDTKEIKELGAADYLVKANLSLQELGDRVMRLLED
jgi:CheY-like chemotaxis protein